jgi:hypothetical protein
MQQLYRHNKMNQQVLQRARVEAEQAMQEVHVILSRTGRSKFNVAKAVSMAAGMGLLRHRPSLDRQAR